MKEEKFSKLINGQLVMPFCPDWLVGCWWSTQFHFSSFYRCSIDWSFCKHTSAVHRLSRAWSLTPRHSNQIPHTERGLQPGINAVNFPEREIHLVAKESRWWHVCYTPLNSWPTAERSKLPQVTSFAFSLYVL